MLRSIRIILASLSIIALTLLFVDFTGTAVSLWPWMAKIQLVPAILSANLIAVAIILLATLLFGRIYCSLICPLGILQDVAMWVRGHVGNRRKLKFRFRFSPAYNKIRLSILSVFVVLLIIGLFQGLAASIAGLIDPYSAYGRIASQIFAPVYDGINNLLAAWSESRVDDYMFYRVMSFISIPLLVIAIVTLVTVLLFAWTSGRNYCNTICPVGTFLGLISRHALVKPVINTNLCVNCGKCGRRCKSSCIDVKNHSIDYSRCVMCMDCIDVCGEKAIRLRSSVSSSSPVSAADKPDSARRSFMAGAGFVIGSVAVKTLAKDADGGLTALKEKQTPVRTTRVVPPGAVSFSNMRKFCTGCQLCVQSCPSDIIRPTVDFEHFMHPQLDFTRGFCATDCTRCSDVCPNGALRPLSVEDKSSVKIGTAIVDYDACISANGDKCGNCASRCPAGAIQMVAKGSDDSVKIPVVNESVCIGCGACEYYCPVGTVASMEHVSSAIHVEGLDHHRSI
ncbi:MAG: 4Fe-4S binding protein [Muribaculaceae bacterium]|nr:4Fe-4S binding protein [Muribaculaceae bacterium]